MQGFYIIKIKKRTNNITLFEKTIWNYYFLYKKYTLIYDSHRRQILGLETLSGESLANVGPDIDINQ